MTGLNDAESTKTEEHDAHLESEHRLSDIINFLPDATFAIDENGVVIAWNHAIEEMTGVSAAEMIGIGDYAYAVPFYGKRQPMLIDLAFKDDPELRSRYDLLKEMPGAIEAETRYARPKGEERILWARVSPLYNRNGEYSGAIETIRDITKWKQSEALLKVSEIRYRRLFEAAQDGILILDDDGEIIDANPFILDMLGYRLDELLGRTLPEIGLLRDKNLAEEAFLQLKKEGYIRYEDLPLETKDGRLMEVEFISNRYAINDHSVIQCNIRDVTARKMAESALNSSESLQRLILTAMPDILIRCNAEGRYLDILTPDDDRLVLPRDEVIGKTVTEVTSEEIGERVVQAIALALGTGEMQMIEYALSVPAGHRHFEARISPYTADEVIVLIRDITDRKEAEEQIALHIRRAEALLALHRIAGSTEGELMDYALDAALQTTDSRYAFIGTMDDDESVMTVHVWSEGVMEDCRLRDTPIQFPIESGGVWGECVITRSPTLINVYTAPHPTKHGLPEGHLPISRYLSVPVFIGSRVFAVLAVANKEGEYRDDDISVLTTLGNLMGELIFRQRSEAALQKSEERYRYVSTIITDFAYSCLKEEGGNYQIDWMAGATQQITGYEIDEVIAEKCWGFMIHPDDWQIFEDSILSLPEGESSECDLRIITKDGNVRWLSAETRCIRDETGRSRIYGGCRDITEEKTAGLELEQNQARLELTMEVGGIAWWEMDCLTGEVMFSPRKAEMIGYSPDRFSHYTDFTELLHPDDLEMVMQAMRDHFEGRADRYEVEYRILSGEGAYLWFRDIGSVTERDAGGAPLKVVGLVVNVTTMKEAVEALRESEALLSTAGRMTHFGGWSINLDENRVIWSDEVARIHGMEPGYSPATDEAISFYAPEWKEKIMRVFGDCIRDGISFDEEVGIITASEERRWVRVTGEAIKDKTGQITGLHGGFQDITEKKLAEEERRRAYAQIEENMIKFSALNDQIRNPLTVIMALADLEGGESAEKIIEQVKAIDQIVTLLDQGVLESESIRKFMRRHDQLSG